MPHRSIQSKTYLESRIHHLKNHEIQAHFTWQKFAKNHSNHLSKMAAFDLPTDFTKTPRLQDGAPFRHGFCIARHLRLLAESLLHCEGWCHGDSFEVNMTSDCQGLLPTTSNQSSNSYFWGWVDDKSPTIARPFGKGKASMWPNKLNFHTRKNSDLTLVLWNYKMRSSFSWRTSTRSDTGAWVVSLSQNSPWRPPVQQHPRSILKPSIVQV